MKSKMISAEDISRSKSTVYVFGDNLEGRGLGGQAGVARPFVPTGKAFGIPTKRAPHDDDGSFFSDQPDEIYAVSQAFCAIRRMLAGGKKIVFFPRIGEGLADLEHRSPQILGMIKGFIACFEKGDNGCVSKRCAETNTLKPIVMGKGGHLTASTTTHPARVTDDVKKRVEEIRAMRHSKRNFHPSGH